LITDVLQVLSPPVRDHPDQPPAVAAGARLKRWQRTSERCPDPTLL